jgi:hypothetical protein
MAKITRKNQKVFCGDTPVTGIVAQFGSLKATAPIYSSDPDIVQALPAWGEGWASAMINNYLPAIQDLNALIFIITRQLAYLFQSGVPEWNAGTTYYIGSMVSDGLGGIYKSVIDTNLNQALTDSTKWLNYQSIKQTEIGDNYAVLNADYLIRWSQGATTASKRTVTLPTPSAALKGRNVIVKAISLTGSYPILVVTNDASKINNQTNISMAQYKSKHFYCDGTRWTCLGDY